MAGDKEERHGPYLLWDHKVDGKLTSQSIAREDQRTFEGWIANRRAMEELVAKMLALGAKMAAELKR